MYFDDSQSDVLGMGVDEWSEYGFPPHLIRIFKNDFEDYDVLFRNFTMN